MKTAMPRNSNARALGHFLAARGREVVLLQASPFLGVLLAAPAGGGFALGKIVMLMTGSILVTAHVFVFNDWAGQGGDVNDPRRADRVFGRRGIGSRQVAGLAVTLLTAATFVLAFLGMTAVLLGTAIAALGLIYSASGSWGKGRPIVASLLHIAGGMFHFLLGYSVGQTLNARGVIIGAFFGLVFAAGHLNQEVRDCEADRGNGIQTNAVAFGRGTAFAASFCLFTLAYALLGCLGLLGILPRLVVWTTVLWPLHLLYSIQARRRGLGFESAVWMQTRYRVQLGVVGLAMLLTTPSFVQWVRRAPEQFHQAQRHHASRDGRIVN